MIRRLAFIEVGGSNLAFLSVVKRSLMAVDWQLGLELAYVNDVASTSLSFAQPRQLSVSASCSQYLWFSGSDDLRGSAERRHGMHSLQHRALPPFLEAFRSQMDYAETNSASAQVEANLRLLETGAPLD